MLKIVVCGACGRMGKRIIACAAEDPGVALSGAVDSPGHSSIGRDAGEMAGAGSLGIDVAGDLSAVAGGCDVIIDFSQHAAGAEHAGIAAATGKPIVIGTTGMTGEELRTIEEASRTVPCLVAPNTSVGVNLLFRIAGEVARSLGDDYDIEIIETHHRFKKDAPSGTARRLAEKVAEATGRDPGKDVVYGRSGETGERPRGQIGIHSVRQGDVIGEHVVSFATLGERVELVHKAHSRDTFARGAIMAAKWIVGREPGMYDMSDVLN